MHTVTHQAFNAAMKSLCMNERSCSAIGVLEQRMKIAFGSDAATKLFRQAVVGINSIVQSNPSSETEIVASALIPIRIFADSIINNTDLAETASNLLSLSIEKARAAFANPMLG